jgi:adenine deaminase
MSSSSFSIAGNIVDLIQSEIFPGTIDVVDGRIQAIRRDAADAGYATYLLPGFVDSHVHVESSLLVPSEFARLAVVHGTVATVSDPHEIANVLGVEGINYMIENGNKVPFKFFFGAPSCVPATGFETAGAALTPADTAALLERDDIWYLSEMMNFPGVLHDDPEVLEKLAAARRMGKPVDGHAPGLRGEGVKKYADAGISTDHECFTLAEALEKLEAGMKIAIREGSAARNFDELVGLLTQHADRCMFCTDDKHVDSLLLSHIDDLARRAIQAGHDALKVLRCACVNPVEHYKLPVGLLQAGDPADFIEVTNLEELRVLKTFIDGRKVAEAGRTLIPRQASGVINQFAAQPVREEELQIRLQKGRLNVIEAIDHQLVTRRLTVEPTAAGDWAVADPARDILKLAVVNRYRPAPVAVAFVKNFGFTQGAIASSVAHDSHNIIAVGASDAALAEAINLVVEHGGGLSATDGAGRSEVLPLPVAGLMSPEDGYATGERYIRLEKLAKECGSPLDAPFMTLSFMALLVIPALKLSDQGLFDGDTFQFSPLFE